MRTLFFIVVGLLMAMVLVRCVPATRRTLAASLFTVAWLVVSALNLRIGLSHGYTLAQELPIHVGLFGVPVIAAWVTWLQLRVRES